MQSAPKMLVGFKSTPAAALARLTPIRCRGFFFAIRTYSDPLHGSLIRKQIMSPDDRAALLAMLSRLDRI